MTSRRKILLVGLFSALVAALMAWIFVGIDLDLPREAQEVHLTDVTGAAGIEFRHEAGARGRMLNPETFGPGAGWLDFDGDGLQDILFINGTSLEGPPPPGATCRLYRNRGGGRFEDATERSGLGVSIYGMGFVSADVDADGDPDILIYGLHRSVLFLNDGSGRFRDATEGSGLALKGWVGAATFLDYDRDGKLDLFAGNYVEWSPESEEKLDCTFGTPKKKYCPVAAFPATAPQIFRGRGDGTFEERTGPAGLAALRGKALGVAVEDYDRDGDPDIFVANDSVPNFLLQNRGDGTFADRGLESGFALDPRGTAMAGMGIDSAWLPDGGALVLAVGNFSGEPTTLHVQEGRDFFAERSMASGIGRSTIDRVTFGLLLVDIDLDGWLDLFTVNGHVFDAAEITGISYRQKAQVFLGRPQNLFEEIRPTEPLHFLNRAILGRALAASDYDGDGDLDFVVTENQGAALLLRNDLPGPRNFARIDLRATRSHRDALGAEVVLRIERPSGVRTLMRTRKAISSYLSQSERQLTFGLGSPGAKLSAEVAWPSGHREVFAEVPANRAVLLVEGTGAAAGATEAGVPRSEIPNTTGEAVVSARRKGIESLQAGRPDEAVRSLGEAVRLDPADLVSQRTLVAALDRLGRSSDLDTRIGEIVRLYPDPNLLLSSFAAPLRQEGHPMPAEKFYEAALGLDPRRVDALLALGNLAFDAGRWDEALRRYGCALELKPDALEALTNVGKVHAIRKDYAAAARFLDRAVELRSDHAAALSTLGGVLIETGDLARAEEVLGLALRSALARETLLSVHGNLGILYMRKRDPENARASFKKVLELDPGDRRAQAALERMGR